MQRGNQRVHPNWHCQFALSFSHPHFLPRRKGGRAAGFRTFPFFSACPFLLFILLQTFFLFPTGWKCGRAKVPPQLSETSLFLLAPQATVSAGLNTLLNRGRRRMGNFRPKSRAFRLFPLACRVATFCSSNIFSLLSFPSFLPRWIRRKKQKAM